jgi:uncharacterized protein
MVNKTASPIPSAGSGIPFRRILRVAMLSIAGFFLLCSLFMIGCQRHLIYFPRSYESGFRRGLPVGTVELSFEQPSGKQAAFYVPADGDPSRKPTHLWVCFHGNAATGLDWLDTVKQVHSSGSGFLLADYPGYGLSAGRPSRNANLQAAEGAFEALARYYQTDVAELSTNVNVLAFSIGTGVGLDFAVRHPVRRVILLAPFTRLVDVARRSVGWPLCHLLRDRYDNAARLRELAARPTPPHVQIFHGVADDIIPFRMGRTLAEQHPKMIEFHAVPGSDHNFLLDAAERELLAALRE